METIKVSKTVEVKVTHSNSQMVLRHPLLPAVQCAEAKLVLINKTGLPDHWIGNSLYGKTPILISETEEMLKDDWYLQNMERPVQSASGEMEKGDYWNSKKILALPEHFTPKQLQDIVDGKMKDGDKVMVECGSRHSVNPLKGKRYVYCTIKQPLTLHKAEESWDEVEESLYYLAESKEEEKHFKKAVKYLRKIYPNPPKRK
jgi:hypothetical protein